jgi:phosphate transport system permease protein
VTTHAADRTRAPLDRPLGDALLGSLSFASTATILLMLTAVVGVAALGGARAITWEFVSSFPRRGLTEGGIFPAIIGTLTVTLLMTALAVPLGVMTAVYLHEYAPRQSPATRLVRAGIQNLAGIPSIVFGLFGLGFFVRAIGKAMDEVVYDGRVTYGQPCLLWASATLAVLTLPVVVVSTEEALSRVPRELRDASLALGATPLQTIKRVVLPEAASGILTGGILALCRGAGEVAPIMFTGAAYYLHELPRYLNDPFMTLGYHAYVLATESPDEAKTRPLLYGTVLVLLGLTFVLNLAAIWLRARARQGERHEG